MKKKAQIEDILSFFAIILIILSAFVYYFYFKTGSVPILKPRTEIKPAEKGVVPPGTFFPKPKKEKLPFILFDLSYAQVLKPQIGIPLKPNKDIETSISHQYKDLTNLEHYKINFKLSAKNLKDPNDKFYFVYLLLPINKEWQVLKSNNLVLELPKRQQYYLLLVTAVNSKNEYDPTFIGLIFRTNISPYFQDIKITYLGKDTIKLKNFSQKDISITNWKITSSIGDFLIPQGVEFINPDRLYKKENIILKPNEEAKIMVGNSPLEVNFKANRCFNYFLKTYPDLKKILEKTDFVCEKLSKEELLEMRKQGYSLNCILALEKAGCSGLDQRNLEKIKNDLRCLNFIYSKWNYRTCYENYKNKENFTLPIWYIFLPVKKLYLPRYEEIKIFDENGLLVDKYVIY